VSNTRTVAEVAAAVGEDEWKRRVTRADAEARVLAPILERVRAGESRSSVLREVLPDQRVSSSLRRLRRFEQGGRDGLIDLHLPVRSKPKVDAHVLGALRALAVSHPEVGSVALAELLSEVVGITIRPTAVQKGLRELGLARPRGRRPKNPQAGKPLDVEEVRPLTLAGLELLKAVDQHVGAIEHLTDAMGGHLAQLPEPEGPVPNDTANRDARGRFESAYNQPSPRTEPELGARFDTVEKRRKDKDLPKMRVAAESAAVRLRKNKALTYLPAVVRSSRWSALEHWRGDHLDEVAGFAYRASTLDKYLRELKLSGAAEACRQAVTSFWLDEEGDARDAATGAVILYVDTKTKPLWTHHWTRATKVSQTGRVMPAISTMTLHSGAGTPLIYRSWSGSVSLPGEVMSFLDEYEEHAGEGTTRRVVVMDREAHSVALFKAFGDARSYIVPLRSSVVGPRARFEEVGDWQPWLYGPDEVCGGFLWLNDSRKGEKPLRVRVVGRRRHRTGKIAWYATNVPSEEFPASEVIRLYFERWPAQEHVYRDGSGYVGLDIHHGYGKRKVDNVAVLDKLDKLDGQTQRLVQLKSKQEALIAALQSELSDWEIVSKELEPEVTLRRSILGKRLAAGESGEELSAYFQGYELMERWVSEARSECQGLQQRLLAATEAVAATEARQQRLDKEQALLEKRRKIFTVDVDLDEVLTSFKLTFINLCCVLMDSYLGKRMELETLIEAVLTLPGERVLTPTTETVRIYRPDRAASTMKAVERATSALTDLGLKRGDRTLQFEVVPRPTALGGPRRSGGDTS